MTPEALLVVGLAGVFGSLIGSFLNVVIYRMPLGMPMGMERSMCPKCKKQIAWFDNIPVVSYLVLLGRCRSCNVRISPRYPSVELLTAVLFAVCAERAITMNWELIGFLVTSTSCAVLVSVAYIAWDRAELPAGLVLRLLPVTALMGAIAVPALPGIELFGHRVGAQLSPHMESLVVGLAGGAIGWVLLWGAGKARPISLDARWILVSAGLLRGPGGALAAGILGVIAATALLPLSSRRAGPNEDPGGDAESRPMDRMALGMAVATVAVLLSYDWMSTTYSR